MFEASSSNQWLTPADQDMDISYFANPLTMMLEKAPDADLVVQSEYCEYCKATLPIPTRGPFNAAV